MARRAASIPIAFVYEAAALVASDCKVASTARMAWGQGRKNRRGGVVVDGAVGVAAASAVTAIGSPKANEMSCFGGP